MGDTQSWVSANASVPYCMCVGARKPPLGWTMGRAPGTFVCSECDKPSRAEHARLGNVVA